MPGANQLPAGRRGADAAFDARASDGATAGDAQPVGDTPARQERPQRRGFRNPPIAGRAHLAEQQHARAVDDDVDGVRPAADVRAFEPNVARYRRARRSRRAQNCPPGHSVQRGARKIASIRAHADVVVGA